MISRTLPRFWEHYGALTAVHRAAARKAYARFAADPAHPSLRFKPLEGFDDYWSVRVSSDVRAVCRRDKGEVTWFWIGSHNEFDKLFG